MCSGRSDWALPQPGFPIRRSTDHSSVDSSPWLIAATHVLHRHLAPRHPPLALCSLTISKMLVLAMQVSRGSTRPEASGSDPIDGRGTGAELDGTHRGDLLALPGGTPKRRP